ncbi:hypothetical protein [Nodularia sphaerocarpa]|uniref:hypothetical protein n=1 Tax=Nodularia sphaerocarpa TaxID=137816 RepID=UPI001EFC23F1|nr:hypothetical protein [Nodularia sphaerocarpa]MDB9373437.1 hypothetical protein [Nodularia sphaerocarpa CS-585]MDB9379776.1 hypothetical protein [Nodularia sphaerocarpa CS-585A2]ULP74047.1 hypothetical protein BDGGKGIB_03707 [Nodularia sphaerocarpa UHCC 0038]
MNLRSSSVSVFWKASLSLAGLIGCITFASAPASAQILEDLITLTAEQGGLTGSITFVTPSGYITTVAAEKVSPEGTYLLGIEGGGVYTVTGTVLHDPITRTTTPTITLLTGPTVVLPGRASTIESAVIDLLRSGTLTLDEYTAILRASVGSDGLD